MQKIKINEIFHSIQGEGQYAGQPAVFVRFHGCHVCCPFCDTPQAQNGTDYKEMSCEEVCQEIKEQRGGNNTNIVVITGGEPFEQAQQLLELTKAIRTQVKMTVHIETSGTVPPNKHIAEFFDSDIHDILTLSPKHPRTHPNYLFHADEVKCLIGVDSADDIIPNAIQKILNKGHYNTSIYTGEWQAQVLYFQPIAYKDKARSEIAMCRAIAMCKKYNVPLSVQLHKYLGIR